VGKLRPDGQIQKLAVDVDWVEFPADRDYGQPKEDNDR